tara:strand:+ start:30671 stop:31171 length:501 start_codon:yes stop_codon:yes gene_type:complete
MNREIARNFILYSLLLSTQLYIFNHFNLFGFITPFIYIIIFIIYKTNYDKTFLIFIGFITGIIVDLTMHTYGCHTLASITVCFLRNKIEKNSFGVNSNLPLAMIKGTQLINRFSYFSIIVLIHTFLYYTLLFFSLDFVYTILSYSIVNSIVTFILVWIISQLVYKK